MQRRSVLREVAVAATKVKKLEPLRKVMRPNSVLFPRLTKLAEACRAVFSYHAKVVELRAQSTQFMRSPPAQSNNANRSAALNALLLSALALPGMVGTAHASSDDVVKGTTAKVNTLPSLDDTARPDEDQEIGIQYSHYREGARNLIGPVTTGIIPASPGSTVTGTTTGIGNLQQMTPIVADGEHAYAKFRIGDRTRVGIDFVQDVWSGASPLATLPASMITGASTSAHVSGYFNAQGQPLYQSSYQANANPANPAGTPQHLVYTRDTKIGHSMGYASAETRKQTTLKYGYDWDDTSIDIGTGVSSEVDFLSKFANVAVRRDLNDKRTSVNLGLSYTNGYTHAEWNADGYHQMARDAWPGQFNDTVIAGTRLRNGQLGTFTAPLITGSRNDIALTGGVTQVVNKNDVVSTGFGYTNTTGFLTNPWKGANVFFPAGPDPAVLAAYPTISYGYGSLELEKRPSLRNQFTWDTSYLHYFDHQNAAGQLHYSLFVDSWGIIAHTVDGEWRQSLGNNWIVTPRLRYYTQSAANFYAPYFFASSIADLPNHNFSSDERLSAFGTLSPGISVSKKLSRGLKLEAGVEYSERSGSLKLGPGGDGSYADLHSYTFNLALRGSLDSSGTKSDSSLSMQHQHMNERDDLPVGRMDGMSSGSINNHTMPASEHGNALAGTMHSMHDMSGMDMSSMSHESNANGSVSVHTASPVTMDGMSGMSHDMSVDNSSAYTQHMTHHDHADAPAGVMNAHMMDEPGSVMLSYTFEQDRQGGTPTRGTQAVANSTASSGMWISDMTMNMHMVELMYAQNAWLNWMVMPQLVESTMNMSMYEIVGGGSMAGMIMPMRTFMSNGGIGDTTVTALIRLWDGAGQHLHLSQGISVPTGSVSKRQGGTDGGNGTVYPYDMQTGSGTWDYKPSVTYTGASHQWNWGAQLGGTVRLQNHNSAGYSLGNEINLTAWGGYRITPWLNATVRELHSDKGAINGAFNSALPTSMYFTSDYTQANYGGHFDDLGLGLSFALGTGTYANDKLSFEWLKPIRTDFNGTQPNRVSSVFMSAKFLF